MNTQLIPQLRLSINRIINKPVATEITERSQTTHGKLSESQVLFKANDGMDYYVDVKFIAHEVFTAAYPMIEPNEDDIAGLTDQDYLNYLNNNFKLWKADIL